MRTVMSLGTLFLASNFEFCPFFFFWVFQLDYLLHSYTFNCVLQVGVHIPTSPIVFCVPKQERACLTNCCLSWPPTRNRPSINATYIKAGILQNMINWHVKISLCNSFWSRQGTFGELCLLACTLIWQLDFKERCIWHFFCWGRVGGALLNTIISLTLTTIFSGSISLLL